MKKVRFESNKTKRLRKKKIKLHTHCDQVTGLLNRQTFDEIALTILPDVVKANRSVAIISLGIENYTAIKKIISVKNQQRFLTRITEQITLVLPEKSMVARYENDEFIILLIGSYVQTQLTVIAHKLISAIENIHFPREMPRVKINIGVSCFPDPENIFLLNRFSIFFKQQRKQLSPEDQADFVIKNLISLYSSRLQEQSADKSELQLNVEKLIQHASRSRELAKKIGSHVEFYSDGQFSHRYREFEIELGLHEILNNPSELTIQYFPVFLFGEKKPVGLEVRLQWEHPRLGSLAYREFNSVATRLNISQFIETQAMGLLKEELAVISHRLPPELNLLRMTLAIGFSVEKLTDSYLIECLTDFIKSLKLPANCVELQLSETQLMQFISQQKIPELDHLCSFQLVLDDYITHDELCDHLENLPVSSIKISSTLVQSMLRDQHADLIVGSIILLGKKLKIDVIAEDIESTEQYLLLKTHACVMGLGRYFMAAVNHLELAHLFEMAICGLE